MNVLLIIYDNESYVHYFCNSVAAIAATVRQAGHNVTIYDQAVNHWPAEHLTNYLDNNYFDVVGLGIIGGYWQYKKCLEISEAINKSKNRPEIYVLGGQLAAPEPEYFLKKTGADCIVVGDGEQQIIDICNGVDVNKICGVACLNNGMITSYCTPKQVKDIDSFPIPAYDLFNMSYYRLLKQPFSETKDFVMSLISGRGCTHACNFCYRATKGFRSHSVDRVIYEMKLLQNDYGINYFLFNDELTMNTEHRMTELCEAFIANFKNIKFNCNGRLDVITKPLAKLMKRAGCVFINYGVESFNDEILKVMNKKLTTEQIVKGVEVTSGAGIGMGLNVIFGNIGETQEHLRNTVNFILKYGDHCEMRTIRPVQPYPGSALYYYALKNGMLKNVEDFYNRNINAEFLSVNFTPMTDDEFHNALHNANRILVNDYYTYLQQKNEEMMYDLYVNKNIKFRGYRHSS